MDYNIRPAVEADAELIHKMANEIWPLVYAYMISADQINYMLKRMYSTESIITQLIEPGYKYAIINVEQAPAGFIAFQPFTIADDTLKYKLHKLYLHPAHQGKGLGEKMMQYVEDTAANENASAITLNVNKHNKTIAFYKKMGYTIAYDEVIDIGEGYVMDDYVMEKSITGNIS